jgi:two-component system, cell cycle response regulator
MSAPDVSAAQALQEPPLRLLLADDSRMVRISLIKQIKDLCQIHEVSDGQAAWEALVADPHIDILITDIGMPQLDGYGLLARLRESTDPHLREMPAIVISGEEDEAARQKAREAGATDFITKGLGTTELRSRIEALGNLVHARRALAKAVLAAEQTPIIDPESGLSTPIYLMQQGVQHLASGRRHQTSVSLMALQMDVPDALAARLGERVLKRIALKLGQALKNKVRTEDTVCQEGDAGFLILSPMTESTACRLFARRLSDAVSAMKLEYHGENLSLTLSVGIANSVDDDIWEMERLLATARERVQAAQEAGGNQVRLSVDKNRLPASPVTPALSLDALRLRLQNGDKLDAVSVPSLLDALIPLLELVESRTGEGVFLERLRTLRVKYTP